MKHWAAAAGVIFALILAGSPSIADDTTSSGSSTSADNSSTTDNTAPIYFFSMRSIAVDDAPQFVQASQTVTDNQSSPVQGCDGNTYYLSQDDADTVNSALSAGATVQLHTATEGTAPQDASILCLIQASQ